MTTNKIKKKIFEINSEINELKESEYCQCYNISVLECEIEKYTGIKKESIEYDYDNLKFLFEKECEFSNPYSGKSIHMVKFYECPCCKKPKNIEPLIAFA